MSAKWLTIVGAVLLLAGLLTAFLSSHYSSKIQGPRRMGVITFGPERGTREWKETERLLRFSDGCFYAGLILTAFGVLFQTWGAVLAMKSSYPAKQETVDNRPSEVERLERDDQNRN